MKNSYVIISAVRNEEQYIERTICSVISQTIKPVEWVIVNDGSKDKTAAIVDDYSKRVRWIKLINLPDRGYYLAGPGVVNSFNRGVESLFSQDWEFIVKMDCDISFDADYFEKILNEFRKNSKLGIASGCTFLLNKRKLIQEKVQDDHPVGPCKVYKRECFESIGGLRPIYGWDLADILSAQMKEWDTRCFKELIIIHYRQTGTQRRGITKGKFFLGRMQYRFGYTFLYTCLKALNKVFERPYLLGSAGIIFGYLYSWIKKEQKYFDEEMTCFLRNKHKRYILERLRWKTK
ncbi:MAG: glycosyltransferase [Candidatus Omnitrophica bacterium]|nr:glycosyltransferase [Candidatus Omnitrophota bacterium]